MPPRTRKLPRKHPIMTPFYRMESVRLSRLRHLPKVLQLAAAEPESEPGCLPLTITWPTGPRAQWWKPQHPA